MKWTSLWALGNRARVTTGLKQKDRLSHSPEVVKRELYGSRGEPVQPTFPEKMEAYDEK
jgi:hypothetical protein